MITKIVFALITVLSLVVIPISANAQYTPDVEIVLASEIFHYGEKLDYKIIVSEVTGEDVVIFISKSGMSDELAKLLPPLRRLKVTIIAITGDIKSFLARHSDIV